MASLIFEVHNRRENKRIWCSSESAALKVAKALAREFFTADIADWTALGSDPAEKPAYQDYNQPTAPHFPDIYEHELQRLLKKDFVRMLNQVATEAA